MPLGLKVGMSTMRDKLGLPDPDPDEELLAPARSAPAKPTEPEPEKEVPALAAQKPAAPARDAIDDAVDEILLDWEPLVAPLVAGLDAEIAAATSLDAVKAMLARRFETMNVAELQEQLAQAVFAARLAGEVDDRLS